MIGNGDDYRTAVRKLESMGFTRRRCCGSHAVYAKGGRSVTVVVNHMKDVIAKNTVKMMNRQIAGDVPWSWGGRGTWQTVAGAEEALR